MAEDGVSGVTSNPSIFEKALTGSSDYNDFLAGAGQREDRDAMSLYEEFAVADVRQATDVLRPVYDETQRGDGYVSLEVSPYLAHDTEGSVREARRLWNKVGRENLMIKIPATPQGIPAFQQLIGEGINVNVTLLFAQEVYEAVAQAYLAGLESLVAQGGDVSRTASVASVFVSRIDTMIDALLSARLEALRPLSRIACAACWARPRSPTPGWHTRRSRASIRGSDGRRWPTGEPGSSACSGRARARSPPTTATSFTWRS